MEKLEFSRLVVYPSDVVRLTGKSLRTAQRMLEEVRDSLGRPGRGLITVRDFLHYFHEFTIEDMQMAMECRTFLIAF